MCGKPLNSSDLHVLVYGVVADELHGVHLQYV